MLFTLRWFVVVLMLGLAPAIASAQGTVALLGSSQFAAGRYGSDRAVSTLSFSAGVVATTGRLRLWANLPIIFQDAASVRTVGGGMVPVGGAPHGSSGTASGGMMGGGGGSVFVPGMDNSGSGMTSHAGVGDPLVRLDVTAWGVPGDTRTLALFAAVKAPIARPEEGFGSGRWDEAVGAAFAHHGAAVSVFADAAFWKIGRAAGEPYRDAATGALTVARPFAQGRQSVFGTVAAATPLAVGLDEPLQLGFGWSRVGRGGRALSLSTAAGLTAAAPAVTLAAGWQWPVH